MNKQITSIVISAVLIVTLIIGSAASGSAKVIYGDSNNDGEVNCIDATCIQRYLLDMMDLDKDSITRSIVSGGDELSIVDATLIQRYDVELIRRFPVEDKPDEEPTEPTPDYVKAEANRVAQVVRSRQNADTVSFLAVTDLHYSDDLINIKNGDTHAGQGMKLIKDSLDLDFGVVLGDNGWQSKEETLEEGLRQIISANRLIDDSLKGIPNFRTPGNHCSQIGSYRTYRDYHRNADLYLLYGAYNTGATFDEDNRRRGYCYRDFDDKKLRVITLNTSDLEDEKPDVYESINISAPQLSWLVSALDVSGKTSPSDWQILILAHAPLDWNDRVIAAANILNAYDKGSSGSVAKDGVKISYDFSGKQRGKIIAQLHGHLHNYLVDNLSCLSKNGAEAVDTGIKRITVPNACYSRNNQYVNRDDSYLGIDYGESVTYKKYTETENDTAFCVFTIDTAARTIYADRYGAGIDRVIKY